MAQIEVYYAPPPSVDVESGHATLEGDEAHHLLHVRRARPGETVIIISGLGDAWRATFREATRNRAVLELGEHLERWNEPPIDLCLGLGTLKGDRFSDAVDMAVQCGVHDITPLGTRNVVSRWNETKARRARKRAIVAAKQCARGLVPRLHPEQPLDSWSIEIEAASKKILLSQHGGEMPAFDKGETVVLAVGCEGGFTDEEEELLMERGFLPVTLGPRRLRSETAAAISLSRVLATTQG